MAVASLMQTAVRMAALATSGEDGDLTVANTARIAG